MAQAYNPSTWLPEAGGSSHVQGQFGLLSEILPLKVEENKRHIVWGRVSSTPLGPAGEAETCKGNGVPVILHDRWR